MWREQQGHERQYYDVVRDRFNASKRPDYLLYLLARCVKAAIRYNAQGDFNQSPDNRRLGRNPRQMRADIMAVSTLLKGRTTLTSGDYRLVLDYATPEDLVYLDPPYQGVCTTGDPRYVSGIDFHLFIQALEKLHTSNIPYILSYDGRTGEKVYGQALPPHLDLQRLEIRAGRSTQATLLGRNDTTYESIYLSAALVAKLQLAPVDTIATMTPHQPALFHL